MAQYATRYRGACFFSSFVSLWRMMGLIAHTSSMMISHCPSVSGGDESSHSSLLTPMS